MFLLDHLRRQFHAQAGYEPNLLEPRTFNEKIQWLKLFYHDPLIEVCTDKISVKDHAARIIGAEHCVPTIAVLNHPDELAATHLARPCALKLANGSGKNLFVRDPADADPDAIRRAIAPWFKPEASHYLYSAEWAYRDLPPRVVIEPLIASPDDIVDYKFFCFGGEPRAVMTCTERTRRLKLDFFDPEWRRLPFARHYPNSENPLARPERLDRMTALARRLAEPFPFVRVDLYDTPAGPLLGELTFYPGNGMEPFQPAEWDRLLGDWLELPGRALISPAPGAPPVEMPREHAFAVAAYLDGRFAAAPCAALEDTENGRLRDKIRRMQTSFSWRVTSPLRALRRGLESFAGTKS